MQGMKWRLSFHSARPSKQLKKLWTDYCNVTVQDKQTVLSQQRVLLQFIDGVEVAREVSSATIIEELDQDIPAVLVTLLKYSSQGLSGNYASDDKELGEERVNLEVLSRVLHVCELLAGVTERPIPNETRLQGIGSVLECLTTTSDSSTILVLLRVLKKLINTATLLREFVVLQGLDCLVSVIDRSSDSSTVNNARNMLCSLVIAFRGLDNDAESSNRGHSSDHSVDHQRSRAMSSSSTGSVGRLSTNQFTPKQSLQARKMATERNNRHPQSKADPVVDPNPLKSLNYAWNVISELLKNTPIAGGWFAPTSTNDNFEEREMNNLLDDNPFLANLMLSAEDIDMEHQRIAAIKAERDQISLNIKNEDAISLQAHLGDIAQPLTCLVHGLRKQVLDKIATAQTPSESINAFMFLFAVVSNSITVQEGFFNHGVIASIATMLDRVENNLSLLQSCNDATRAAAAGTGKEPATNSPEKSTSADAAEFSEYHHSLAILLVRMMLNDPLRPTYQTVSIQYWRGMLVKNIPLLALLTSCLRSKFPRLALVALHIALSLLAIHPTNAVLLEAEGVVACLINTFATVAFRGKFVDLKIEAPPTHQVILNPNNPEDGALPWGEELLQVISIVIETLQVLAVCFSGRDSSIPLTLTWVLLTVWSTPTSVPEEQQSRCTNCEVELAVRHCLNESCIQEQCFKLCEECDKVFHKSVVKRSHIRMPLAISEALSNWMVGFADQVAAPYATCLDCTRTLHARSFDIREDGLIDQRRAFLRRREVMTSLAIAGLRGMWDDRKVKLQPLPPLGMRLLINLTGLILQEPFSIINMRDDVPVPDGQLKQFSAWTELLEDSDPAVPSGTDARVDVCTPPEINHLNSRRIILSLVIQTMGRFLLCRCGVDPDGNDAPFNEGLPTGNDFLPNNADSIAMVELFLNMGADALLVHCAVDTSSRTCLTSMDRQYIWWLLRECSLSAIFVCPAAPNKLLSWFNWILRCDAVVSNDSRGGGKRFFPDFSEPRRQLVKDMTRRPSPSDLSISRVPNGPPRIHLSVRLLVLQEIRMMMAGSNDLLTTDFDVQLNTLISFSIWQLPSSPTLASPTVMTRNDSFDSLNKDDDWANAASALGDRGRSKTMTGPCFSHALSALPVKRALQESGMDAALYDLICDERILGLIGLPAHAIQEHLPAARSLHLPQDELNDLEKEVWWSALVALSVLCCGHELSKSSIEDRNGLQVICNLLTKLISEASGASRAGFVNPDYERALSAFLFELCISNGQVLAPSKPFRQTVWKFPKGPAGGEYASKRLPASSKPVMQLFSRSISCQQEGEVKLNQISTIPLSSAYYTHEKTMIVTWATLRPHVVKFPIDRIAFLGSIGNKFVVSSGYQKFESRTGVRSVSELNITPSDTDFRSSPFVDIEQHSLKGRRTSKRLVPSASLHSLDNESRWELESVGRSSALGDQTSRGSFNSHQSVAAVLQAFKNMPISSFFANDQMDSSTHARSVRSGTDRHSVDLNKAEISVPVLDRRLPTSGLKANRLAPLSYCDSLNQMCLPGKLDVNKAIVLYHHTLLLRTGLSSWLTEDTTGDDFPLESPASRSGASSSTKGKNANTDLKTLDGYYLVLRRHLSLFMPQIAADASNMELLNWQPSFSSMEVRNEKCMEILLSAIICSTGSTQTLLFNMFCELLESNPVNAHSLAVSRSLTVVLTKLLPHLSDHVQDLVGAVLSRMLAYSANTVAVKAIFDIVASNEDPQAIVSDIHQRKVLFILGKAVERNNPQQYIHFSGGNAFTSGIPMPAIPSMSIVEKALTVCTWIRLGSLTSATNHVLAQINRGKHSFQLFLRTVRMSNTRSSSVGHVAENVQYSRVDNWRRTVQLCWSISDISMTTSIDGGNSFTSEEQCTRSMVQFVLGMGDESFDSRTTSSEGVSAAKDGEMRDAVGSILQVMGSFAFPDAFVELPIEDNEKWHFICLTIGASGAACFIDGVPQAVKFFTPFGYVDPKSSSNDSGDPTAPTMFASHSVFVEDQDPGVKDVSMHVTLGGMKKLYFKPYSIVQKYLEDLPVEDVSNGSSLHVACGKLLSSAQAVIAGFVGAMSEVALFEGVPDGLDVQACYNGGSQHKPCKLGKLKQLGVLGQHDLHQYVVQELSGNPLVQKQQNLKPVDDTKTALHGVKVYSPRPHQLNVDLLDSLVKPEESVHGYNVHVTMALPHALHNLGGFRLLYPLLSADSPQAVATLRILEGIIRIDDDYAAFKREGVEKAVVFAISSSQELISVEVFQSAFELATTKSMVEVQHSVAEMVEPNAHSLQQWRPEMLESFMDLVIASNRGFHVSRCAVDWLSDFCYDSMKLSHGMLKTLSMTPFYVILSLWSVGASSTIEVRSEAHPVTVGVDGDKKRVLFASKMPSLIAPQDLPLVQGAAMEPEELTLAKYKLQLSCVRMFKQILDTITLDAHTTRSLPAMDMVNMMLPSMVAFALHSARCKHLSAEASRGRDHLRRSEKLKALLRKTCGALPILRNEDVMTANYWQLSASVGCWLEIMSLLMGRFGNVFLSSMKTILPGVTVSQMALELMASPSVELRGIGIRILILFLVGSDGKLDSKQVGIFDKMNGFHAMAKQLCNHSNGCDDLIVDGLFSLLFWQVHGLIPVSNSPVEMKPEKKEDNRGSGSGKNSENMPGPLLDNSNYLELFVQASVDQTEELHSLVVSSESQGVETTDSPNSMLVSATPVPSSPVEERMSMRNAKLGHGQKDEEIMLPQVLEVILSLLQSSQSLEQIHRCIHRLQRCLGDSDASPDDLEDLHARNLESVFGCKDWLLHLCDMVAKFRRNEVAEDAESAGVLSLSEPESLTGPGLKRHDSYMSGGDSEEWVSNAGDSVVDESVPEYLSNSRRSSLDTSGHRRFQVSQFTTPVLTFIRKLLMLDMFMKCNSNRRWLEVFRLSLPETAQIQEEIVLDIVNTMQHAAFLTTNHKDQGFNYLKNMGALLEQVLERMKVSLPFCVAVVGALHALSYRCSIELRTRMKDTMLPEVKKNFIVRCLIDVGQEIFHRVHCLVEISASLQAYFASNESKAVSDSQVVYLLFGMLQECFEHLEMLVSSKTTSPKDADYMIGGHRDMDAVTMAIEMLQALVTILQGCVKASPEARKTLLKFLEHFPVDTEKVLERAFTSQLVPVAVRPAASVDHCSDTDVEAAKPAAPVTSGWWSSWSTTTRSVEAAAKAASDGHEGSYKDGAISLPLPDSYQERRSSDMESGQSSGQSGSDQDSSPKNSTIDGNNSSQPTDVRSFVYWYCASAQRAVRTELHGRVQKELKSVLRFAEKLRERYSQRLLKYTKALQDKRSREKVYATKAAADALQVNATACDKATAAFLKDIAAWVKAFKERLQRGQEVFHGTEQAKPARLSGRDTGLLLLSKLLDEPATLAGNLESFKIPEALIDYLAREATNAVPVTPNERVEGTGSSTKHTGPLTKIEALNALIQCFVSGRRIAEG